MDFLKLAGTRYSVRKFSSQKVEKEKIEKILQAAELAPTACNKQPQRIYVLQTAESLEKLQSCKTSHFGETLAFLICYDRKLCWKREYDEKLSGETDAAIVATHMMLEAWELDIGSTWIMHFIPEAIRSEFRLPDTEEPAVLLVMGYAAKDAVPSALHSQKKDLSEIVEFR